MMYSAYKLNKQGDNINLDYSFPNLETVHCSMSGSLASLPVYMFHRRQIRWSGIPSLFPQFVVIHTVKGFSLVNEADV